MQKIILSSQKMGLFLKKDKLKIGLYNSIEIKMKTVSYYYPFCWAYGVDLFQLCYYNRLDEYWC